MNPAPHFSRREFLALGSAAPLAAFIPRNLTAADRSGAGAWPIGCFNRPWTLHQNASFDDALDGVKAAGYSSTGLLTPVTRRGDIFTSAAATPEYLANLRAKVAARGLKLTMTALRVRTDLALPEAVADTRKQIEHAQAVGAEFALTFGEDKPERYAHFFKIMADAAAFAQDRGIKLVMKPHGGDSGASEEILAALKTVAHANFKIWYDAGNIVYYTGKDPVEELKPIVQHVTGFCAKDCVVTLDAAGKPKPDVLVQFGTGKVDFAGVFRALKAGGFSGPVMVECCKVGATVPETTENARANRLYLENVLASL